MHMKGLHTSKTHEQIQHFVINL